jgi:uncharacterized protein
MKNEMPADEPSMDEILASIRDIISGDAQDVKEATKDHEDILDLTEALPEEGPKMKNSGDGKKEDPKLKMPDFPKEYLEKPKCADSSSHPPFADPLVSSAAMSEAALALQPLNKFASQNPKGSGAPLHEGLRGQIIEDLVREMLRPLLKEWLDAHLPTLVRWVVNEQVERIVRQVNAGQNASTLEKHLTTQMVEK